jgi:hypothetical protein
VPSLTAPVRDLEAAGLSELEVDVPRLAALMMERLA